MFSVEPQHPGSSIRRSCLEPRGFTVADGARILRVTRQALHNVVTGKTGISPEMALRLEKAFGDSAETWLQLQLDFDLFQVRRRSHLITVINADSSKGQSQTKLF